MSIDHISIENAAAQTIEAHGKPEETIPIALRGLDSKKLSGLELTNGEFTVVKALISREHRRLTDSIKNFKQALRQNTSINRNNDEQELAQAEQTLRFLEENLMEKFFSKKDVL